MSMSHTSSNFEKNPPSGADEIASGSGNVFCTEDSLADLSVNEEEDTYEDLVSLSSKSDLLAVMRPCLMRIQCLISNIALYVGNYLPLILSLSNLSCRWTQRFHRVHTYLDSAGDELDANHENQKKTSSNILAVSTSIPAIFTYTSPRLSLAKQLIGRFQRAGRTDDLTNAIMLQRQSLSLCPPGHLDRHLSLDGLASSVRIRFERFGQVEDLEEAIALYSEALQLPEHPDHLPLLNKLANCILNRFEHLGQWKDLEETIVLFRKALDLCPADNADRPFFLNSFANSLRLRFEQLHRPVDISDAITFGRQTLVLCPLNHPDRVLFLNGLANSILTFFNYVNHSEDFEEGIALHREALSLCSASHLDRFPSLMNLANGLMLCSNQFENLEEAITLHREALSLRPVGSPGHFYCLRRLANDILVRGHQLDRTQDLRDAINYGMDAMTYAKINRHPLLARVLGDLAGAHILFKDYARGIQLFEEAADCIHASCTDRLEAALAWSEAARIHHHASAFSAFAKALQLSERCFIAQTTVELQQEFLARSDVRRLVSRAASYCIEQGRLETAVEMLEQGRGLLWSKMRAYRHPIDGLEKVNAELADRFHQINSELESVVMFLEETSADYEEAAVSKRLSLHHHLLSELDDIVDQIREVPGFSTFFTPTPFSYLQTAAVEGPVIMVNVTVDRSDALIIQCGASPILVPLNEDLSPTTIFILSSQLSATGFNRLSLKQQPRTGSESSDKMTSILRTLWEMIVKPVAIQLKALDVPIHSRIWWCPIGDLSLLPLHAAGPYSTGSKNFYELFVSSYTPTLSSLITVRRDPMCNSRSEFKLLAIGQSQSLPQVKEELKCIERIFANHVEVLDGDHANPDAVLAKLHDHPWVHLACHGSLEAGLPFKACFILHGASVSLRQIIKAQLSNAELAFLAACHSAAGEEIGNSDEALSLAAAMQFCGYRAIVGTLWAISDDDGPAFAQDFYMYMLRHGLDNIDVRDSATALHFATEAMRKRGIPIHRWSPFVHVGV